jgi:hypothetical protein
VAKLPIHAVLFKTPADKFDMPPAPQLIKYLFDAAFIYIRKVVTMFHSLTIKENM